MIGHKLMLCGLDRLPSTLDKILLHWDPAHPPRKVFYQLMAGWGCMAASPGTQAMLCIYRLPELPQTR